MDKHDTILLACGTPENRAYLRSVMEKRFNLLEAANSRQAMLLLNQNIDCIATMILDTTVPENVDIALLEQPEHAALTKNLPVIAVIREDSPELLHKVFDYGVTDAIALHYEPYAMLRRIENVVDLHLHKQHLEAMVKEQADVLRHSKETMVDALSSIIEHRSAESGQHILRIRHFTRILLEEVRRCCPEYQLDEHIISVISSASALHDIGKIAIPDSILMKPGPLTSEEREIMKSHAATGCRILDTLGDMGDPEYLRYAHNICHYHHERWDGGGYPEGLSGDAIPICAQVVGLADVYDALTSKRVYKDAFSFTQAVHMILRGECGIFSPKLLECFKHVLGEYEALARAYADGLSPRTEAFDTALPPPKREQEENSLGRVRAKYFALVHYINGLLMEVDLKRDLMHLIYNPYPELLWLRNVNTFSDLVSMLDERVIDPEGRSEMVGVFSEGIRTFMEQDLRRSSYRLRFRSKQHPEGDCFEVTLLRINPIDADRRTLAILFRRIEEEGSAFRPKGAAAILSDSTCVCRNDTHYTLVKLGSHIPLLAGYTPEELQDKFQNRLTDLILPEDREAMRRSLSRQLLRGTAAETEFRVRHKSGKILWVLDKCQLQIGPDGEEYLNSFLTDISHTKKAYEELSERLRQYEIILAQTENVLFQWDMAADTIDFSNTWENIFGSRPKRAGVRSALSEGSYFHPDDLPLLFDRLAELENGSHYEMVEVRISTTRGRYLWCRIRASAIRDEAGNLARIAGIIINIDAEKQAERLLQDRAERDALTKLTNKTAARKQAEEYLSRYSHGTSCALLIIDLDDFKQVNDQYGHLFGDAVLTKAAREIEKLFRNQDIVARIGGDEFMVLMRGVSDRTLLENRCRRLLQIFQTTFHNQKHKLPLSCSIGIALFPEHGSTYFELFNRADQALYRSKAKGKNSYSFYDEVEDLHPAQKQQRTSTNTPIDSDEEPGLAESGLVRYAFQQLYSARDTEKAINDILSLVGSKMNVSRVYVFENSEDNRFCSNTYEWCNVGIEPQIGNLQYISYERDIPGYEDNFDEQGIFYCPDVAELPQRAYDIVAEQGIQSMLQCAIRDNGVFRGYIGFDECKEQRFWTREQIDTLTYFSEMLSMFLLKQREHQKASARADQLSSLLDNQNAWIYIIDPDDCRLRYLNARCRQMTPEAEPGMLCYRALAGRESRCEDCPALTVRESGNSSVVRSCRFAMDMTAEASLLRWEGKEACMVTCRKI